MEWLKCVIKLNKSYLERNVNYYLTYANQTVICDWLMFSFFAWKQTMLSNICYKTLEIIFSEICQLIIKEKKITKLYKWLFKNIPKFINQMHKNPPNSSVNHVKKIVKFFKHLKVTEKFMNFTNHKLQNSLIGYRKVL